jgi:glycosyltransferase involved in cell wall biosynthesis
VTPSPATHGQPYRQTLPDLAAYRADFATAGVALPLPIVPWRAQGLLGELPPPPPGRRGWPWDTETAPFATPAEAATWPKLTIVTPSFRQGDYLEEALRSVLLQNYPNLEFVVLDGGSTDASPAIIERYRPWLSFARVQRDRGQSHAINLGFSLSSGQIHGWLNSDDFYLPGAFRRVAEAWRKGAEFIYGDALSLDQASGRQRYMPAQLALSRYVKFPGLVPSHASFWSARRHQPLWEEQHCAVDYELWIRLLPGLRRAHLSRAFGVIREHPEAKSHDPKIRQRWDEDAARNGLAHPELYRPGLASRLLAREFVWVQAFYRRWRNRGLAARLEALRQECHWPTAPEIPS